MYLLVFSYIIWTDRYLHSLRDTLFHTRQKKTTWDKWSFLYLVKQGGLTGFWSFPFRQPVVYRGFHYPVQGVPADVETGIDILTPNHGDGNHPAVVLVEFLHHLPVTEQIVPFLSLLPTR